MLKKYQTYLVVLFTIVVIVTTVFFRKEQYHIIPYDQGLNDPVDYFATDYPSLAFLDNIPYYTSNQHFDYVIFPGLSRNNQIDVYLSPKFTDVNEFDTHFANTKNEIFNWIIDNGTLISDLEIKWYIDLNGDRALAETTNPKY